jgi:3-oxoacyl-[acyl-carrier-protein] synthase-1
VKPLLLSAYTTTTCLGRGLKEARSALREGRSGLKPCDFESVKLETWIGEVPAVDAEVLPADLTNFDCRNNRLAQMGLETDGFADAVRDAARKYGLNRVGVFLGTSTSGILEAELAYRQRSPESGALPEAFDYQCTQNSFSVAEFTRAYLGLQGMAMTVSTACSSSAKVFAAAARQLALGTIDAAVVGGVDTLCLTTLHGFASLQLTSSRPCKPYDVSRDGISIGEGAAFAMLERGESSSPVAGSVFLVGVGESSDAYHMSAPHPEGLGARLAMQSALHSANLSVADVGYINLHGTSTPANDAAEAKAVMALFGNRVPCSSTKGATGHTLGAAGALEAIFCAIALTDANLPGSPGTDQLDPATPLHYLTKSQAMDIRYALSNSFGFGGSNCSLIFGISV